MYYQISKCITNDLWNRFEHMWTLKYYSSLDEVNKLRISKNKSRQLFLLFPVQYSPLLSYELWS